MNFKKVNLINLMLIFLALPMFILLFSPNVSAEFNYKTQFSVSDTTTYPYGISSDDTYIYIVAYEDDRVYFYYKTNYTYSGTSISTTPSSCDAPQGITVDDDYIWVGDHSYKGYCKFWKGNGTFISNHATSITYHYSMQKVGDYLYSYNASNRQNIYWINNATLISMTALTTTGAGYSSTTNGTYIWAVYNSAPDVIYKYYLNGTQTIDTRSRNSASQTITPLALHQDATYFYLADGSSPHIEIYYQNTTFEQVNLTTGAYGEYLNSPGNYHLKNDVSSNSGYYFFTLFSDDVYLDGENYLLSQSSYGEPFYYIVYLQNINNLTIKNLRFTDPNSDGYGRVGIFSNGNLLLSNSLFENLTFSNYVNQPFSFYNYSNVTINNVFFNSTETSNSDCYVVASITGNDLFINNLTAFCPNATGLASQFYSTPNMHINNLTLFVPYSSTSLFGGIHNSTINNSNITYYGPHNYAIYASKNLTILNSYISLIGATGATTPYLYQNSNMSESKFYNNYFYSTNFSRFIPLLTGAGYGPIYANTTNSTGPNIVDGTYIGGNYYSAPLRQGFSETCSDADADGFCDTNYSIYNFTDYLPLASYSRIFTSDNSWWNNSLEYTEKEFEVLYQYPALTSEEPTIYMEYNGTNYTMENNIIYNNLTATYNLRIPGLTANYNETRNITYYVTDSTGVLLTASNISTVYKLRHQDTNAAGASQTIVYQCKDEITFGLINCNLTESNLIYAPENYGSALYYRSYPLYRWNSTTSYTQYQYPSWGTSWSDLSITSFATGYPQRISLFTNITLTNTSQTKTIWMLDSGSGLYVTFQVTNFAGTEIKDVHVTATTVISGIAYEVCEGYTDDSGVITCWLNPNAPHVITFESEDYDTMTKAITPTNTLYIVTMGEDVTPEVDNPVLYFTYSISPNSAGLSSNAYYNFTYQINASDNSSAEYGMAIRNSNETLCSMNGANKSVDTLYCYLSTETYPYIYFDYNYTFNGKSQGFTKQYSTDYVYSGDFSIKTLFEDIKWFSQDKAFGPEKHRNFTLMLIAFAVILLITGILSYISGVYSPIAISIEITALTWFFNYLGFIPSNTITMGGMEYVVPAIPLLVTMVTIAFIINDNVR